MIIVDSSSDYCLHSWYTLHVCRGVSRRIWHLLWHKSDSQLELIIIVDCLTQNNISHYYSDLRPELTLVSVSRLVFIIRGGDQNNICVNKFLILTAALACKGVRDKEAFSPCLQSGSILSRVHKDHIWRRTVHKETGYIDNLQVLIDRNNYIRSSSWFYNL